MSLWTARAMKRLWIAWAVVVVVALVTAVVPGLRDQARLVWATLPPLREAASGRPAQGADPILAWFNSFRQTPMQAARRWHAGDPELLGAAGTLLLPQQAALSALQQTARDTNSPLLWSAYTDMLLDSGIQYERVGMPGANPAHPRAIAQTEQVLAQRHTATALTAKQAQPLLEAVEAWRRADPENGLPLAVEAWCLYGLHRDAEALARWEDAARQKKMDSYHHPRVEAMRRLLVEVGYPEPEAIVMGNLFRLPSLERLRSMARAALYEGRRAQLAERAPEAVRTWRATQLLGRRLEDSAQTFAAFVAGADLEATGGMPAWVWVESSKTGEQGPGPNSGHLYYGPAHAFYAAQVGPAADAALRDGLLKARMRLNTLRRFSEMRDEPQWYPRAGDVLAFAQMLLVLLLGVISVAVLAGLAGRGGAPALRSPWHLLIALPSLAVLAPLAGLTTGLAVRAALTPSRVPAASHFWGSVAAALLAAVLCPLLAALSARPPHTSRLRAWRANLLTGLPIAAAVAAVVYLGSNLAALKLRSNWVRQSVHPKMTEMQMISHSGGDKWGNPPTPPESWRAQEPPRH